MAFIISTTSAREGSVDMLMEAEELAVEGVGDGGVVVDSVGREGLVEDRRTRDTRLSRDW
jgi:hypothetical protein